MHAKLGKSYEYSLLETVLPLLPLVHARKMGLADHPGQLGDGSVLAVQVQNATEYG